MNYRQITILSFIGLLLSIITFAWYHDLLIINLPTHATMQHKTTNQTIHKKVALFYTKNNKQQAEERELLWSKNIEDATSTLVQAWLALLEEEEILTKKITVQEAALCASGQELLISFDQSPFDKEAATGKKIIFIEDLLKTLRTALAQSSNKHIQKIRFLVNHKPLQDPHLDFSQPWALTGFMQGKNSDKTFQNPLWPEDKNKITIMIDPAGDAHTTGRIIDDTFERSITMQAAQELKKMLEEALPAMRILLTRFPGETVEPLQNAAFANRLHVDLYLHIACYQEKQGNPHCALYHFLYDPVADWWPTKTAAMALSPYQQAHRDAVALSAAVVQALYKGLQEQKPFLIIEPVQALPFKPLVGVHAPAIGIEMGLPKKGDWNLVIKALGETLRHMLQK